MRSLLHKIESALQTLPAENKQPYFDKIKTYSSECGCSLGAKFLAIALVLFISYLVKFTNFHSPVFIIKVLYGLLFVFISSIIGKLIGIGIARIKLIKLYRSLLKYQPNNIAYVNMHQMG